MLKNIAKRLKLQYKDDKQFQTEYDEIQRMHLNRIKGYFKEEEKTILEEISLVYNRQYAQGMLLVEMFKEANENLQLIEEQVSFIDVMNTYPTHLFNIFKDSNQDIYYVDTSHALGMDLLASKGIRVFEIFKASCADITNFAIANTLYQMYSILVKKERIKSFVDTDSPVILNSQYFISPFVQSESIGSNLMQYDMFTFNSPQRAMSWVGRIMCYPFNPEVSTLDVYLSDSIDSNEKQELLINIGELLQNKKTLQVNLYNISAVTTFTYMDEQTKESSLS